MTTMFNYSPDCFVYSHTKDGPLISCLTAIIPKSQDAGYQEIWIHQWGSGRFKYITFYGNQKVSIVAHDLPNLSECHSMRNCFKEVRTVIDPGENIAKWSVSNVTDMTAMFAGSHFTIDITNWDVSNVRDMTAMFQSSEFNGDLSRWKVNKVTNMCYMFQSSRFNGDISQWEVSQVRNMSHMFDNSRFNGDLSKWTVNNVVDMHSMFKASQFQGDLSKWTVNNVVDMTEMFFCSQFNGEISNWKVDRVKFMRNMFTNSQFNGDISQWIINNSCDLGRERPDPLAFIEIRTYENESCPVCEVIEDLIVFECRHYLCLNCFHEWFGKKCPLCRAFIKPIAKLV